MTDRWEGEFGFFFCRSQIIKKKKKKNDKRENIKVSKIESEIK